MEPAATKEVRYFDRWKKYSRGERWYHAQFPSPTWKEGRRSITGEASPNYLFHPHAARRMAEMIPEVRLIVLLRNPVDRAYSGYHLQVRKGFESLPTFEDAIREEEARLRGERKKMLKDERYDSYDHRRFSYLARGIYVDQLIEWSRFFSRKKILILKSEDLFEHPIESLKFIWSFLDLPDWEPESLKPRKKRKYPPMNPVTRQQLHTYFKPHNERLYEYLGVDLGW